MNKINISVIIPCYHGQTYVTKITSMLQENFDFLRLKKYEANIEAIFVNDSPQDPILVPASNSIKITLISNAQNMGIHFSRIAGLKRANGDFILFLDQDDQITKDFFYFQIRNITKSDVSVANALIDLPLNKKRILYKHMFLKTKVNNMWFYLNAENQIFSPGQCLLRRRAIPEGWIINVMKSNGSDDFLLWILMLKNKARFSVCRKVLYHHIDHNDNVSNDKNKIIISNQEILSLDLKLHFFTQKERKAFEKSCCFLQDLNGKKLNLGLFWKYKKVFFAKFLSHL